VYSNQCPSGEAEAALYVGLVGTLLVGGALYLVALAVMAGSSVGSAALVESRV